jgi:protein SCO1/2
MRKIILIGIYVILAAACHQKQSGQIPPAPTRDLPFYNGPDFTPVWFHNTRLVPEGFHRIPAFSFIDQNEDTITEKTIAHKIYVADFFFTSCPGICPKLTKNLKMIQDSFRNDAEVVLLSHSVTPGKDIPAVLKRYAINYGVEDNKWFLLTGSKEAIYSIARKGYFADEDLGMQKDSSDFLHTENMLLIDKNRHIRGIYKGTSPAEMQDIINDIRVLKNEY